MIAIGYEAGVGTRFVETLAQTSAQTDEFYFLWGSLHKTRKIMQR